MVDEANKRLLAGTLPDADAARLETELEQLRLEGEKQHASELTEAQARVVQLEAQLVKVKAAVKAHLVKTAVQTAKENRLRAKRLEQLHSDLGQAALRLQSTAKAMEMMQAENSRLKQQLDASNAELARRAELAEETRAEAQAAFRARKKVDAKVPEAVAPRPAPGPAPGSAGARRLVREGKEHVSKLLSLHRSGASGGAGSSGGNPDIEAVALPLVDWYVRLHELLDPPQPSSDTGRSMGASIASADSPKLEPPPAACDSTPAAATPAPPSATMASPLVAQALASTKPGQLPSYITAAHPSSGRRPSQPAAKVVALSASDAAYEAVVASLDDLGEEDDMDALMGGMV
jgi:hypothetical protein